MHELRELTKEDLKKLNMGHGLTVGRLKQFLNKYQLPDDAPVLIQRIEDMYYEKHDWGVYLKEGEHTHYCKSWNEDIKCEFLDAKKYPKLVGEELKPFTDKQIKDSMEQYHPAFSCVQYNDDKDILFIDLHY